MTRYKMSVTLTGLIATDANDPDDAVNRLMAFIDNTVVQIGHKKLVRTAVQASVVGVVDDFHDDVPLGGEHALKVQGLVVAPNTPKL